MQRFLLRRFAFVLISILGATAVVFVLSRAAGDPLLLFVDPDGFGVDQSTIDAVTEQLALDKPLVVQYGVWLGRVVRGDLGRSLRGDRDVATLIFQRLPATAELAVASWLVATLIGIPMGVLSAVKRGTMFDYLGRGFALFGQATPTFWVAIMAILLFSVQFDLLPAGLRGDTFRQRIVHIIIPMFAVGTSAAASYLRLTRSSMLEVLDSEFVKLARAKGVSKQAVIWKHAFRNALIQPITISAVLFAHLITGTVVAEVVFAWPGLGRLMVEAVWRNDFPVMMGAVLVFVVMYAVLNFIADILYGLVDPRIRYS